MSWTIFGQTDLQHLKRFAEEAICELFSETIPGEEDVGNMRSGVRHEINWNTRTLIKYKGHELTHVKSGERLYLEKVSFYNIFKETSRLSAYNLTQKSNLEVNCKSYKIFEQKGKMCWCLEEEFDSLVLGKK